VKYSRDGVSPPSTSWLLIIGKPVNYDALQNLMGHEKWTSCSLGIDRCEEDPSLENMVPD
jgi:hypothetical protein